MLSACSDNKLAAIDFQHMEYGLSIKQTGMRNNSHQVQLKNLHRRVQMLAEGGEWVEVEVTGLKQDLSEMEGQVESLSVENKLFDTSRSYQSSWFQDRYPVVILQSIIERINGVFTVLVGLYDSINACLGAHIDSRNGIFAS